MKKISIIVPCYNEEAALPLFYPVAHEVLEKLPDDYELIFVNDGSKDKTLEILRDLAAKDPHVFYISFSRNFGKEAGLLAGLERADGDLVTVMDADLQDPPEMLVDMYQKIQEGYDIVGTRRSSRTGEPVIRSFFAKKFYQVINQIFQNDIAVGSTQAEEVIGRFRWFDNKHYISPCTDQVQIEHGTKRFHFSIHLLCLGESITCYFIGKQR